MHEKKVTLTDLKSIKPFRSLHAKTLNDLVRLGTIRVYQPHTTLYRSNTINTKLLIILRGNLTISYAYDEELVPVEILDAGDLWGYTTLLKPGKKYPYEVQNGSHVTEVIELPVSKILTSITERERGRSLLVYELAQMQAERSRKRQRKVALLFGLSSKLNREIDSNKLLSGMLELVTDALEARRALIATFDDITKQIIIEETRNYDKKVTQARYAITADTLLSVVYNTGDALSVTKKNFERKFNLVPYSRPSMIIAPIYLRSVVYGAILCADKENDFTTEDLLTLQATSVSFAQALSNLHSEEDERNEKKIRNTYIAPSSR